MNLRRPRRGLIGALVLTLGVTGLTVISTSGTALAAPHNESPPSVQIGWSDSATPGTAYQADDEHFPLGTWQDEAGANHTARVYATFDLSRFEGSKVYDGKVFIRESSAADCTKRAIEIWRTKPVSATPTWNRAPEPLTKLDEVLTPEYCPTANITFDVGDAVKDAVARKQRRVTFEIRVPEQYESDPAYGRRLNWYRSVGLSVQYNTAPAIDNARLYNGGFPCTQFAPYPRLGWRAYTLQALGTDADQRDDFNLRAELAIWPKGSPEARQEFVREDARSGLLTALSLPEGTLVDGKSYVWQARFSDGVDTSAWSKTCYFTYDATPPAAPTVTSSNYPRADTGQRAPAEPAVFTFSGNGKKDVAGFHYSWTGIGFSVCDNSGDLGQLVCKDPFSLPDTVKAAAPGGSATVTINPISSGRGQLTVRSIDLAGNVSAPVVYESNLPYSRPDVLLPNGPAQWGEDVLLKFVPATAVTGVQEYEITLDGQTDTRQAEEDGTAYFSFIAGNVNGHRVTVRSRSVNGFISDVATWSVTFPERPGVKSDIYVYPADGSPVGGVGVEGTFTFSPPPGWTDTAAYRYSFVDGEELTEIPAGPDGRAALTWTPTTSGRVNLMVFALRPDGTWSESAHEYYFEVAGSN